MKVEDLKKGDTVEVEYGDGPHEAVVDNVDIDNGIHYADFTTNEFTLTKGKRGYLTGDSGEQGTGEHYWKLTGRMKDISISEG